MYLRLLLITTVVLKGETRRVRTLHPQFLEKEGQASHQKQRLAPQTPIFGSGDDARCLVSRLGREAKCGCQGQAILRGKTELGSEIVPASHVTWAANQAPLCGRCPVARVRGGLVAVSAGPPRPPLPAAALFWTPPPQRGGHLPCSAGIKGFIGNYWASIEHKETGSSERAQGGALAALITPDRRHSGDAGAAVTAQ